MTKSHVLFGSLFGRSSLVWLTLGLLAGLTLAFTLLVQPQLRAQEQGGATIVVSPAEANFHSASVIWIYGSNLTPGSQVTALLVDGNGVYSDVTAFSQPFPAMVNDDGAFAVKWTLGRWTRGGVGAEGIFTLLVVDEDFSVLGTAPLSLCNHGRAEGAEVPAHCSQ